MFPNDSRRGIHGREAGFTLLEAGIAIGLSLVLGLIVHRFYRDAFHTYSQQEQIEERNQNANFTVSKMVEVLQQAGYGLPEAGWVSMTYVGGVLTMGKNPTGVQQFIGYNPPSSRYVRVDDATLFRISSSPMLSVTHILVDYAGATATAKFQIDTTYGGSGFLKGLKNNATGHDSIYLTANVDLSVGDIVYGYREDQYLLLNDSLIVRPNGSVSGQMVLAENIDSLGFTFKNAAGGVTTVWSAMRSASFTVRARTGRKDPRLPAPGYHKISLPMNVILRNKV